ncbi:Protein of unknown function [Pyronema omphalodes CBS 100304]|uniref:Uncharacterized protein n=1 Tax=Pyronema omphalodes (strain CBS 100304) TaxID=1076935 RepID=U4LKZ4_PYROM|nr:Protein of unknown function [Pyronema omphalodes CBS 100304]
MLDTPNVCRVRGREPLTKKC